MKCEICGRECNGFQSLSSHIKLHKIKPKEYYDSYLRNSKDISKGKCLYCEKETNFIRMSCGYFLYCSEKCAQNSLEVRKKRKKTILDNYGVDNIFKDVEYIKKCMIEKFGVENASQLKEIKDKKIITHQKNHGVDNYSKTPEFRKLARLNKIKLIESQTGRKINPKEGKNENSILNELESSTNEPFLRNQCFDGYFPDSIGKVILTIIEVDEYYHFSRRCYIDHDRIKNEYYISKGYIPIHIKESDWFEDKELQIIKFQETIRFLKQVQDLNK